MNASEPLPDAPEAEPPQPAPERSASGGAAGPLPLAGLRVVAVEHAVAAPLCSRHLADLGAEVIKVESPRGGDLARGYDSAVNGFSAYFVWGNRGKRSVVLDLKSDEGRRLLGELLSSADVFVHNLGPGAMDRLGFDHASLSLRFPSLINCAISGYGDGGPYRHRKAFDLLIQGEAGLLSVTGDGEQPAKVGISVADMCAGVYAVSSILAALLRRQSGAGGTYIDVSMLECLAEWMMAPAYHQMYGGTQLPRAGARHNMMVPYGVYSVGDGHHVNLAVQTPDQWRRLCIEVLERPDLVDDARFSTNETRVRNRAELEPIIESAFRALGLDRVVSRLTGAGIPTGDVNDLRGLLEHPQLAARDRWTTSSSRRGPVRVLRSPFNLEGMRERPASIPELGEDTAAVLAELGTSPAASASEGALASGDDTSTRR